MGIFSSIWRVFRTHVSTFKTISDVNVCSSVCACECVCTCGQKTMHGMGGFLRWAGPQTTSAGYLWNWLSPSTNFSTRKEASTYVTWCRMSRHDYPDICETFFAFVSHHLPIWAADPDINSHHLSSLRSSFLWCWLIIMVLRVSLRSAESICSF